MRALQRLMLAQLVWVALGHLNVTTKSREWTKIVIPSMVDENFIEVSRLHVTSHIEHRYAHTRISGSLSYWGTGVIDTCVTLVLPENAYISSLDMEIDGIVEETPVTDKTLENQVADEDRLFHVEEPEHFICSNLNSKFYIVHLPVTLNETFNFNLTYEELLIKKGDFYDHTITLNPGQAVDDLRVDVHIKESKNITVKVPARHLICDLDPVKSNDEDTDAQIERPSEQEAHISLALSRDDQIQRDDDLEQSGYYKNFLFPDQFVVRYGVDRSDQAGELLENSDYFVHFFVPPKPSLKPKHLIILIDISMFMDLEKEVCIRFALNQIFKKVGSENYFSIMTYSCFTEVMTLDVKSTKFKLSSYNDHTSDQITTIFPVYWEYFRIVMRLFEKNKTKEGCAGTNINNALRMAMRFVHQAQNKLMKNKIKFEPVIVFLMNEVATVGETNMDRILTNVKKLNAMYLASIYGIPFGNERSFDFMKKLCRENFGVSAMTSERIYIVEEIDKLLKRIFTFIQETITFEYPLFKVDMNLTTRTRVQSYFQGSEIIVAGKRLINDHKPKDLAFEGLIAAKDRKGQTTFKIASPILTLKDNSSHSVMSLERLWAFLTIKQLFIELSKSNEELLEEDAKNRNCSNLSTGLQSIRRRALHLALKYSFVTPLTSLTFAMPNTTKTSNTTKYESKFD